MKHVVIVGHPNPSSFNMGVAKTYCDAVEALGHTFVLRDLYRCGFDPRLQGEEIPKQEGFAPGADVTTEREIIGDADVFAFIYPLWFNVPPAVITGYVQRVFGMGFGYGPIKQGGNQPLLYGRRMISFSSSGAPTEWLKTEGGWSAIRNLFDQHVAEVCGLSYLDHRHYGRVLNNTLPSQIEAHFRDVKNTVGRYFTNLEAA